MAGVSIVVLAACGSTTSPPVPTASTAQSARVHHSGTGVVDLETGVHGAGPILVNAQGLTLYSYAPDGVGQSVCVQACADAWPPLGVSASTAITVGPGVDKAKVGTIVRPDGTLQVTYAGHPLYTYIGDHTAGQTTGQGVAGVWSVVEPAKFS